MRRAWYRAYHISFWCQIDFYNIPINCNKINQQLPIIVILWSNQLILCKFHFIYNLQLINITNTFSKYSTTNKTKICSIIKDIESRIQLWWANFSCVNCWWDLKSQFCFCIQEVKYFIQKRVIKKYK